MEIGKSLKTRIKKNIEQFQVVPSVQKTARKAAVTLTIVSLENDPGIYGMTYDELSPDHAALILTRRNSGLKNHAGQWALPGGRIDKGETPEETALRELREEVGLELNEEDIIGRLDDYVTRSGYGITPVVVWGGDITNLVPNPDEVRSIHRVPIVKLLREDAPLLDTIPESENPVLMMPIGDSWIAAPTGAILYQFREVAILGKNTRVGHFEQPYFAWS